MSYQHPNPAFVDETKQERNVFNQLADLQLEYAFLEDEIRQWEIVAKKHGCNTPADLSILLSYYVDDGK